MTDLLQKAFDRVSQLPPDEQDSIAVRLLAEIEEESAFDRKIAASAPRLASLAKEALKEFNTGETEELDPDRL